MDRNELLLKDESPEHFIGVMEGMLQDDFDVPGAIEYARDWREEYAKEFAISELQKLIKVFKAYTEIVETPITDDISGETLLSIPKAKQLPLDAIQLTNEAIKRLKGGE